MLNTIYVSSQIISKTKQLQRSTAKGKQALEHYGKIVKLMRNDGFDNIELLQKEQNMVSYGFRTA